MVVEGPFDDRVAAALRLPSTTNQLEGGGDAVVKRTLDHHRGLSEAHMRRCCE